MEILRPGLSFHPFFFCSDRICRSGLFTFIITWGDLKLIVMWTYLHWFIFLESWVQQKKKRFICEMTHAIKTDKTYTLVSDECVAYRSGGRQTFREVFVIRLRRKASFCCFHSYCCHFFTETCVGTRTEPSQHMHIGKNPHESQAHSYRMGTNRIRYASDLGPRMNLTHVWFEKIRSVSH